MHVPLVNDDDDAATELIKAIPREKFTCDTLNVKEVLREIFPESGLKPDVMGTAIKVSGVDPSEVPDPKTDLEMYAFEDVMKAEDKDLFAIYGQKLPGDPKDRLHDCYDVVMPRFFN